MFAWIAHCIAEQLELRGTTSVHHVPVPTTGGWRRASSPASTCIPRGPVRIPSEKLETSGPGSLSAVPDSPAERGRSQTETENERVVSTTGRVLTAACPEPAIAIA